MFSNVAKQQQSFIPLAQGSPDNKSSPFIFSCIFFVKQKSGGKNSIARCVHALRCYNARSLANHIADFITLLIIYYIQKQIPIYYFFKMDKHCQRNSASHYTVYEMKLSQMTQFPIGEMAQRLLYKYCNNLHEEDFSSPTAEALNLICRILAVKSYIVTDHVKYYIAESVYVEYECFSHNAIL